ncbi:MAG: O-antigen ligase family protein [Firmicutes bacterium]|nr:O-antigen ligase family protein [Bacillota bacterium]
MKKNEGMLGSLLAALPVILFAAVSILTVRLHYYFRPMTQFGAIGQYNNTQLTDFFAYYKMVVIVAGAVMALIMMAVRYVMGIKRSPLEKGFKQRVKEKDPAALALVCVGAYLFFVLLSFVFSKYKTFAWLGWNDRFEGTLTLFAYMIVLVYLMVCVRDPRTAKLILIGMGIAVLLLGIVGYYQASGKDLFRTVWGQKLIVPDLKLTDGRTAWEAIDQLAEEGKMIYSIEFRPGVVYQTLYNINYVPFYLSAVLPVIALCFIGACDRDVRMKDGLRALMISALLVLFAFVLYNFFCANSASGYFGLVTMFLLGLIVFRRNIIKWLKPLLALALVTALIMGILWSRWYPELKQKLFTESETAVSGIIDGAYGLEPSDFENKPASVKPWIDYVETGEDYVAFSINGNELFMNYIGGGVAFTDSDDEYVRVYMHDEENKIYSFMDERFHDYITFQFIEESGRYRFATYKRNWDFIFTEYTALFEAPSGKLITLGKVDKWGFEGRYNLGSGRGYIWSRSIPMLKDTIFIGHGADTFCAYFPNDDYAGKYSFSRFGHLDSRFNLIYDKPHDMYLQTAINTGITSLIAQLGIFFFYFRDSLKTGFGFGKKRRESGAEAETSKAKIPGKGSGLGILRYAAAGCFLGVASFLAVGLFNDSSVSTAPFFYAVLGLGFAINAMIREEEAQNG